MNQHTKSISAASTRKSWKLVRTAALIMSGVGCAIGVVTLRADPKSEAELAQADSSVSKGRYGVAQVNPKDPWPQHEHDAAFQLTASAPYDSHSCPAPAPTPPPHSPIQPGQNFETQHLGYGDSDRLTILPSNEYTRASGRDIGEGYYPLDVWRSDFLVESHADVRTCSYSEPLRQTKLKPHPRTLIQPSP